MALPEPFRGEVWDVDFDDFGMHPVVVLSINALNSRLGHVAVIPVTAPAGQTRLMCRSPQTPGSLATTSPRPTSPRSNRLPGAVC